MTIIKLDAIDSTNSYLKNLVLKKNLENYTVVLAEHQTKGRGQLGTSWIDKKGKNLIFSILVKFNCFDIKDQFYLSMAISLGILSVLTPSYKNVKIKWPNDILSDKDKIAGILIENSVKGSLISHSVVGIGLNVNQLIFDRSLHNATSLRKISGSVVDKDDLFDKIMKSLLYYLEYLYSSRFIQLKKEYLNAIYKFEVPTMFKDKNEQLFLGKIVDVNRMGKLVILTEDDDLHSYDLKEIKFASTSI